MYEIRSGEQRIAVKIGLDDIKDGLNFFTNDTEFLQLGGWRYPKGKRLLVHNHNLVQREIDRTQEFAYVVKGSMKAFLYDEDDVFLEEVAVGTGEGIIMFAGGHGYEIQEEDTVVLEVKNGPFPGPDKDRRRLENQPEWSRQEQ